VAVARRSDAERNREAILEAAARLMEQSPGASLADVADAAGVSRSTVHRHFGSREALRAAAAGRSPGRSVQHSEEVLPPGRLGRGRGLPLDAIHVFDAVPPPVLPQQLVAEAERRAQVPVALYVPDIDGSHLLRIAGPERLPERIEAPLAIGPELDRAGLTELRERLQEAGGVEVVPLWLRGRATGVLLTLAPPERSLAELARQASAAITLADRYSDTFARAQRRKRPKAAAEIQQSLLPPRITRISGGEVAGNVLPSYEVAGDWFDVAENFDGVWMTVADGLGGTTRATAAAAVALGALRAARRSDAGIAEALLTMHTTLKEMPGPRAEMTAVITRWDPAARRLGIVNCGHVEPVILRSGGSAEPVGKRGERGLGGRARPTPTETSVAMAPGDRVVLVSDGVTGTGAGKAGLGIDGVIAAARRSSTATAADTVRNVHTEVLERSAGELADDATVLCMALG
jgi:serine phosphatase RsbU (regulator of sigma subunit)